ncbi:MAG: HEAT repeat domain-containing protein [Planctomycetota bacterium]
MLKLAFAFLLGGVVGGGLVLGVHVAFYEAPPPAPSSPTSGAVTPAPKPEKQPDAWIRVAPESSDEELAEFLSLAGFDRNWTTVAEVAKALRVRAAEAEDEPLVQDDAGSGSLAALEHRYRQRIAEIELARRDNPATRLLRSERTQAQITQGLKELLLAPELGPQDRRVRRDAALLLARSEDPLARQILLDALEQPDLFDEAAQALARADDPAADEVLLAILRDDQDPLRRAGACRALARSLSLAEGGAAASALARTAREDLDVAVRTHALASLALADLERSQDARQTLVQLAQDPTEPLSVREASLATLKDQVVLAHRLPEAVLDALELLASTERGPLRLGVLELLGEAGDQGTVEQLEGLLPSVAGEARVAVERALERLRRRVIPE